MTVLMLLLLISAVTLITVAVHARHNHGGAQTGVPTRCNAVLTHQSYADAGGVADRWVKRYYRSKAYDTAQKVEAKARDWICALLSNSHHVLPKHVLSDHRSQICGRLYGLAT